jgi:hypothetical protein
MSRDTTMAVIGHYSTVEEAYMVAARLDAAGLKAMVGPYHAYDQLQFVVSPKGVPVMIDREHLDAAREALERDEPEAL